MESSQNLNNIDPVWWIEFLVFQWNYLQAKGRASEKQFKMDAIKFSLYW